MLPRRAWWALLVLALAVPFAFAGLRAPLASAQIAPSTVSVSDITLGENGGTATVTVLDANGNPVNGLGPGSFTFTVNGQPVEVTSVTAGQTPLNLLFVVDTSGSMAGGPLEATRNTLLSLIWSLGPNDQAGLVAFADGVTNVVPMTGDQLALQNGLASLNAAGNTALYDAVASAIDLANASAAPGTAVVFIADGEDYGGASSRTRDEALTLAANSGIPFYTIGLGDLFDIDFLNALATGGGAAFRTGDVSQLTAITNSILARVQSRYTVQFTFPADLPQGDYSFDVSTGGVSGGGDFTYVPPAVTPTPPPGGPGTNPTPSPGGPGTNPTPPPGGPGTDPNQPGGGTTPTPSATPLDMVTPPADVTSVETATGVPPATGTALPSTATPPPVPIDTATPSGPGPNDPPLIFVPVQFDGLPEVINRPVVVELIGDPEPTDVTFTIDGEAIEAENEAGTRITIDPYRFDPTRQHELTATYSLSGDEGEVSATFEVASLQPQIVGPASLDQFGPGDVVRLIVNVQPGEAVAIFSLDGHEVARDDTPPFTTTLPDDLDDGEHSLGVVIEGPGGRAERTYPFSFSDVPGEGNGQTGGGSADDGSSNGGGRNWQLIGGLLLLVLLILGLAVYFASRNMERRRREAMAARAAAIQSRTRANRPGSGAAAAARGARNTTPTAGTTPTTPGSTTRQGPLPITPPAEATQRDSGSTPPAKAADRRDALPPVPPPAPPTPPSAQPPRERPPLDLKIVRAPDLAARTPLPPEDAPVPPPGSSTTPDAGEAPEHPVIRPVSPPPAISFDDEEPAEATSEQAPPPPAERPQAPANRPTPSDATPPAAEPAAEQSTPSEPAEPSRPAVVPPVPPVVPATSAEPEATPEPEPTPEPTPAPVPAAPAQRNGNGQARSPWGWLEVLEGPDAGRRFPLQGGMELIGSGRASTVQLADRGLEQKHLVIHQDGRYYASTPHAAIRIGARQVRWGALNDGTVVTVGGSSLRFERGG